MKSLSFQSLSNKYYLFYTFYKNSINLKMGFFSYCLRTLPYIYLLSLKKKFKFFFNFLVVFYFFKIYGLIGVSKYNTLSMNLNNYSSYYLLYKRFFLKKKKNFFFIFKKINIYFSLILIFFNLLVYFYYKYIIFDGYSYLTKLIFLINCRNFFFFLPSQGYSYPLTLNFFKDSIFFYFGFFILLFNFLVLLRSHFCNFIYKFSFSKFANFFVKILSDLTDFKALFMRFLNLILNCKLLSFCSDFYNKILNYSLFYTSVNISIYVSVQFFSWFKFLLFNLNDFLNNKICLFYENVLLLNYKFFFYSLRVDTYPLNFICLEFLFNIYFNLSNYSFTFFKSCFTFKRYGVFFYNFFYRFFSLNLIFHFIRFKLKRTLRLVFKLKRNNSFISALSVCNNYKLFNGSSGLLLPKQSSSNLFSNFTKSSYVFSGAVKKSAVLNRSSISILYISRILLFKFVEFFRNNLAFTVNLFLGQTVFFFKYNLRLPPLLIKKRLKFYRTVISEEPESIFLNLKLPFRVKRFFKKKFYHKQFNKNLLVHPLNIQFDSSRINIDSHTKIIYFNFLSSSKVLSNKYNWKVNRFNYLWITLKTHLIYFHKNAFFSEIGAAYLKFFTLGRIQASVNYVFRVLSKRLRPIYIIRGKNLPYSAPMASKYRFRRKKVKSLKFF